MVWKTATGKLETLAAPTGQECEGQECEGQPHQVSITILPVCQPTKSLVLVGTLPPLSSSVLNFNCFYTGAAERPCFSTFLESLRREDPVVYASGGLTNLLRQF